MTVTSDDPRALAQTALSMSGYSYNSVMAAWWKLGRSVHDIVTIAADSTHPLSEPCRIALQVMATSFNDEKVRK